MSRLGSKAAGRSLAGGLKKYQERNNTAVTWNGTMVLP